MAEHRGVADRVAEWNRMIFSGTPTASPAPAKGRSLDFEPPSAGSASPQAQDNSQRDLAEPQDEQRTGSKKRQSGSMSLHGKDRKHKSPIPSPKGRTESSRSRFASRSFMTTPHDSKPSRPRYQPNPSAGKPLTQVRASVYLFHQASPGLNRLSDSFPLSSLTLNI
eukprot:scpid105789/ scgid4649/ 